jgi:hypothetical protein
MMSAAPPVILTREQAVRLQGDVQTYRQYALTKLMSSTERNVMLRGPVQIQGRSLGMWDTPIRRWPLTSRGHPGGVPRPPHLVMLKKVA